MGCTASNSHVQPLNDAERAELSMLRERSARLEKQLAVRPSSVASPSQERALPAGGRKYRVLVLDSGAMRGVFTARILENLEKACPGFLSKVDLIAGTSTGALCSSMIADSRPPSEILRLYRVYGPKIFEEPPFWKKVEALNGFAKCKYSSAPLRAAVESLGPGRRLNQLHKHVLICAFDTDGVAVPTDWEEDFAANNGEVVAVSRKPEDQTWRAKFFHNFTRQDGHVPIADACLASAAAPTYFPLHKGYVDGAVVAATPVVPAICQAIDPRYGGHGLDDIVLLNVGTGDVHQSLVAEDDDLGIIEWIKPLLDILCYGTVTMATFAGKALLKERFHRISPRLPGDGSDFDSWDASSENIDKMVAFADAMEPDLHAAVEFLKTKWMA